MYQNLLHFKIILIKNVGKWELMGNEKGNKKELGKKVYKKLHMYI